MVFKTHKLTCDPFSELPDARFFHESPMHARAFRAAATALEKKRLILLTGSAGCGKSLLGNCLLLKTGPEHRPIHLSCAAGDQSTLAERLRRACNRDDATNPSVADALAALQSHVKASPSSRMVLMVDQAENLPKSVIKELVDLIRENDRPDGLCPRVLLIGYAEVARAVFDIAGDDKRITRIGPLANLNRSQVASYIQHRWTVAGGSAASPFSKTALQLIAERTAGNPRCVNRLCTQLLAHMAHDQVSSVGADMVERVLTENDADVLRADISKSEHENTKGSSDMPDSSKESTLTVTAPPANARSVAPSIPPPAPAAAPTPVSGDKALELFSLVERLERALASAPSVISSIESAMAEPKQVLKRCETRAAAVKRQHDSLSESLCGLDDTCEKAEQLQHSLAESVDQLTGIGDVSQEKVTLLLDTLELGNKTRQELEATVREHSQASLRIDTTAADCERRLTESAQSLTTAQERSHRSLLQKMKSVHTTLLEPFGEKGEQISRLEEVISSGIATLSSRASEQKREVESAARRQVRDIEAKLAEHQARLAATADKIADKAAARIIQMIQTKQETLESEIDRRLTALKISGDEHARSLDDTMEAARSRFETTISTYDKRASEGADKVSARAVEHIQKTRDDATKMLKQSSDNYLSQLRDATDAERKQMASDLEATEQRVRDFAESTKEADKILNTLVQNRDATFEKRLAEVADASAARVTETIDAKCEAVEKDIAQRLARFAPTGEETARLADLVAKGSEAIRKNTEDASRDVEKSLEELRKGCELETASYRARLEEASQEAIAEAVTRVEKSTIAKSGELSAEIERRVAAFGPTGEHTIRLAELVSRGVETITGAIEKRRHAIANMAVPLEAVSISTENEIDRPLVPLESSERRDTGLMSVVERSIATINKAADARMREIKDRSQPALDRLTNAMSDLDKHAADLASHTVAEIIKTGAGHVETITRTAEEQTARFAEAAGSTHGQLASQIQAAKEAARIVSESTQDGHAVLNTLIKNREAAESQITKLGEEAEKASWATTQLGELRATADPAVTELRQSMQGIEAANDKTERLIEEVWSLTTTAEQQAREIRECFTSSAEIIERLTTAQRRTEQTATSLDKNTERAEETRGKLDKAVTQAQTTVGDVNRVCQGAAEATSKAAEVAVSARAGHDALAGRIQEAKDAAAEIEGAGHTADETAERLGELVDVVTGHVERQEAAADRCEEAIRRVDVVCEAAANISANVTTRMEEARIQDDSITQKLARTDELLTAAKEVNTNLATQTESAEETLRNQQSAVDAHRKAIDELEQHIQHATQATESLEKRHVSGTKLAEQLGDACTSATQISRQIKTLVAKLIEKRDVYENNERALSHCIERADALGAKMQQIQTRGDAFDLQLGGMLAEPRKIVDEAKSQTTQLNAVCSVVRKIFSGLSKTSLQANKDISRFADISREANARLDDLSEESKRASNTLREWVDEAAHAQSRLAKSLSQVPSIERTHPVSSLTGLANASFGDVPEVLSSAPVRRIQTLPPQNGPARGPGVGDRLGGKTDVATLIRDAERIAEVVE